MDWKLTGATFLTVLFAELGDKTQLATLTFSAGGSSRWAVFIGASAALVLSAGLAVLAGEAVTRWVSPRTLQGVAAVAFLLLGAWMLWSVLGMRHA